MFSYTDSPRHRDGREGIRAMPDEARAAMNSAAPSTTRQVPYFVPDIGSDEIEEVADTLRSGWITTGPKVRRFELEFAEYVGAKHALAINSGTAALQLAVDAAGVGAEDEVIVPTMTFAATAYVAIHCGARPVLVDCRPDTLNIDVDLIESAITPRTKAILPVDFAGHPCDLDRIHQIARHYGLAVIEDAAHALPARYRSQFVGSISDLTCFSLYANKTITTGEGGLVTTDDDRMIRRARLMSWHGINKEISARAPDQGAWYYEIEDVGWKFNMTDIAAAIGLHQLRRCEGLWKRRQRCAELYNQGLADVLELQLPAAEPHVQHAWHLYVIQLDLECLSITRQQFIQLMKKAGVGTAVHYIPLHLHPYYRDTWSYRPDSCPVATGVYERIVSLPIYSRMSEDDVGYVIGTVRGIIAQHRR
jgi:perosamine synthetase